MLATYKPGIILTLRYTKQIQLEIQSKETYKYGYLIFNMRFNLKTQLCITFTSYY